MNAPFAPFKPAVKKNAAMERYHDWTLRQPGVVCGEYDVQLHHVTAHREGLRFSRSHWLVVPLERRFHQHDAGPFSVERLSHKGFFDHHQLDLEIAGLWNLLHYLETQRV